MIGDPLHLSRRIDELEAQLAASEDREARLRAALEVYAADKGCYECGDVGWNAREALSSTPSPELLGALRTAVRALDVLARSELCGMGTRRFADDTLRDLGPVLERYGLGGGE